MEVVMDCFTIGSRLCVTPRTGQKIEGEVMAYDGRTKMLVLKVPSTTKKGTTIKFAMVTCSNLSNVAVISEPDANAPLAPIPQIDPQTLRHRFDKNVAERQQLHEAMNRNVSVDGQQIYLKISKLLSVRWSESNDIIVMEEVAVSPPYTVECAHCIQTSAGNSQPNGNKTLQLVTKRISKYYEDNPRKENVQPSTAVSNNTDHGQQH